MLNIIKIKPKETDNNNGFLNIWITSKKHLFSKLFVLEGTAKNEVEINKTNVSINNIKLIGIEAISPKANMLRGPYTHSLDMLNLMQTMMILFYYYSKSQKILKNLNIVISKK